MTTCVVCVMLISNPPFLSRRVCTDIGALSVLSSVLKINMTQKAALLIGLTCSKWKPAYISGFPVIYHVLLIYVLLHRTDELTISTHVRFFSHISNFVRHTVDSQCTCPTNMTCIGQIILRRFISPDIYMTCPICVCITRYTYTITDIHHVIYF